MARLFSSVLVVIVAAALALAAVWLLGQLFIGLGALLAGVAGVLAGALRFLLVAGFCAGLAYFLASVYRRN